MEYQDKCQGDKSPTHLVKLAAALSVNKLEHMVPIMICKTTEIRSSSHEPQPRYAMYCTYALYILNDGPYPEELTIYKQGKKQDGLAQRGGGEEAIFVSTGAELPARREPGQCQVDIAEKKLYRRLKNM